jgi:D-glycero-alpha-D-manno-heptose 1-phosphate guanylyltransferase
MECLEAIILAGGLGTRLRDVIGEETPKCMAQVAGQPFLHYLLQYAAQQGIQRVVLSLGHKSNAVTGWLSTQKFPLEIGWVIEQEPLGTGGGIQLALKACKSENVVVLNGDTMFHIPLRSGLLQRHSLKGSETTIALKALENFERYGIVEQNEKGTITAFQEKAPRQKGLINGGVYCINRLAFLDRQLPEKFSFEKDYLERFVSEGKFYGYEDAGYFIDIGVPQDYERAQSDFQSLFSPA